MPTPGLSPLSPHEPPPLAESVEAMFATLAMARALVQGGRQVELAGLEDEAAIICAAIQALPAAQARPLRPAIVGLVRELDALAVALPEP